MNSRVVRLSIMVGGIIESLEVSIGKDDREKSSQFKVTHRENHNYLYRRRTEDIDRDLTSRQHRGCTLFNVSQELRTVGKNFAHFCNNFNFLGTNHMLETKNRCSVNTVLPLILFVFGFTILAHADDMEDPHSLQISESEGETFTVMDVETMRAYRDERRETLVESLTHSNLSTEHQELVANAMAKVYVGIPVSSYTQTNRVHSAKEDSYESTNTFYVNAAGFIQQEDAEYTQNLDTDSPFLYFPPVPFMAETGKLLDESDSSATFEFDFDLLTVSADEDSEMSDFEKKMKWVFQITVNTDDQVPERLTVKLAKPVRKRFLFKVSIFQMEFEYSLIESCGCFAVSRMKMQMKGSALIVGRLDESFELTNTDINCDQPVKFLLPDKPESGFQMF